MDDKIEDFVMGIPYLISRKYEEDEVVLNTIMSHHGDTDATSVISVIVSVVVSVTTSTEVACAVSAGVSSSEQAVSIAARARIAA